jgi:hypothetical protein
MSKKLLPKSDKKTPVTGTAARTDVSDASDTFSPHFQFTAFPAHRISGRSRPAEQVCRGKSVASVSRIPEAVSCRK